LGYVIQKFWIEIFRGASNNKVKILMRQFFIVYSGCFGAVVDSKYSNLGFFSDFYKPTVDTNKKWSPVTTITLKKNL
jgi:hypothetical protein